jgi:hypothetical protein
MAPASQFVSHARAARATWHKIHLVTPSARFSRLSEWSRQGKKIVPQPFLYRFRRPDLEETSGVIDVKRRALANHSFAIGVVLLSILFAATAAAGQSTAFTYQGRLTDGGSAATGNYDFQFALWDSLSGGAQIGSTLTLSTVPVSNGIFSVSLDFGAGSFNGANRFLEIGARPISGGAFTLLSPRQPVTAIPYAIRSMNAAAADTATNATQLGGVSAGQFVQTNDSRLSDARPPTAGSSNYIENTKNQQSGVNFNVSGDGTLGGTLSAAQFNVGNNRVLAVSGGAFLANANSNLFVGVGAGASNTPVSNTGEGNFNSFFGNNAGRLNTTGQENSFYGFAAGSSNTTGFFNSLFGYSTGSLNSQGHDNSFFGQAAGGSNTTGSSNTFIGSSADFAFSGGQGDSNTLLGSHAAVLNGVSNATAIGANADVGQSNSLVLGSVAGINAASSGTNVGVGTIAPSKRLEVGTPIVGDGINLFGNAPAYFLAGSNNSQKAALGFAGSGGDYSADAAAGDTVLRATTGRLILQHGSLGAGMIFNSTGTVSISTLGSAGSTSLCRNGANEISTCSSSLRYKTNIASFSGGMNIINRLRPISFEWKQNRLKDIGLGAEEVEKVEPLLTFRNDKGEIEGVRYDRLGVLFVNALKEQQSQLEEQRKELTLRQEEAARQQKLIEQQQTALAQQNREVSALKKLVCRSHRQAAACK